MTASMITPRPYLRGKSLKAKQQTVNTSLLENITLQRLQSELLPLLENIYAPGDDELTSELSQALDDGLSEWPELDDVNFMRDMGMVG